MEMKLLNAAQEKVSGLQKTAVQLGNFVAIFNVQEICKQKIYYCCFVQCHGELKLINANKMLLGLK